LQRNYNPPISNTDIENMTDLDSATDFVSKENTWI